MNYLELYLPTPPKDFGRSAYTTKRLSYRLQRRIYMIYLELYRSAYTTRDFGIAYNEVVIH